MVSCSYLQNSPSLMKPDVFLDSYIQQVQICSQHSRVLSISVSVKQAKELHHQLEYVNTHQNCEVQAVRLKLESSHRELIESRASRRMELDSVQTPEAQDCAVKLKTAQQELKMVRG